MTTSIDTPFPASPAAVHAEAMRLHATGLCVIPVRADGTKAPLVPWARHRTERPTAEAVAGWFARGDCGIAVVGGAVSAGLESLDFDRHGADDPDPFGPWVGRVPTDLFKRLVVYQTPGGGWRVCWRFGNPFAGAKDVLARHPSRNAAVELLGSCVNVVPGGPLLVHSSGRPYRYCRGQLSDLPTLTVDERQTLLFAAIDGNDTTPEPAPRRTHGFIPDESGGWWPWQDFDRRGSWEFLTDLGWTPVGDHHWRRPGKSLGTSASTAHNPDLLHVFSSSVVGLEADRSYRRSAVWTLLRHGGDFAAGNRSLADLGWGRTTQIERMTQRLSTLYGC